MGPQPYGAQTTQLIGANNEVLQRLSGRGRPAGTAQVRSSPQHHDLGTSVQLQALGSHLPRLSPLEHIGVVSKGLGAESV